jgi:Protein of unknown function (DUF2934)
MKPLLRSEPLRSGEEEGRPEGKSVVHWLRAEAEIIGVTDNGKRLKSATPGLLSRVAAARGALRPADARRAGSQSWRDTAVYRSILANRAPRRNTL